MYANFDLIGNFRAELTQHRTRIAHRAATVSLTFVPVGRQAEQHAWITGAQGAHHQVVNFFRILQHDELGRPNLDADLLCSGAAIGQRARFKLGITPSVRYQARADAGITAVHELDLAAYIVRAKNIFFDQ